MAITTTASEVRYVGSGVVGPFAIPFQFLDKAHVKVALKANSGAEPVVLSPSSYSVTRNASTMLGSLTLSETIANPQVLVIYRETPRTQPTVLPTSGLLSSKSVEAGMDRAILIAQELQREMEADADAPVSGGTAFLGVKVWPSEAERGTTMPEYLGQVGVELATKSFWISQALSIGSWTRVTKSYNTETVAFTFVSDAGNPGAQQDAIAYLLQTLDAAAIFFGGNNTQNGPANYDSDWAAFADQIADGRAFPALGNLELDDAAFQAKLNTKFPYVPGNRRYYKVTLGDNLLDVIVANSNAKSNGDPGVAGDSGGSHTQENVIRGMVEQSTARWRVLICHLPPITTATTTISPNLSFPLLEGLFDLVLCGHSNLLELIRREGGFIANASSATSTAGTVNQGTSGPVMTASPGVVVLPARNYPVWTNDAEYGVARVVATLGYLRIEFYSSTGALLFSRNLDEVERAIRVPGVITATDAATVSLVCDQTRSAQLHKVTLGGNRTLAFSGVTTGMQGTLMVKQDATGSRTITLPAGSKVSGGGGGAMTLTATANATDTLSWFYDGTNYFWQKVANFT